MFDLSLPDSNVLQVLATVRKDPATETLPIIIFTGRRLESDIYDGYRNGADMVLTKQIVDFEELLRII